MEGDPIWPAIVGGVVGGVLGWLAAVTTAYWGPRKLDEWRKQQAEASIHGPRKELLAELLGDPAFEWRTLATLSRATGTTPDECRRLLVEIGARGSTGEGPEAWGLITRHPISEA